jgi:hypothetical protein
MRFGQLHMLASLLFCACQVNATGPITGAGEIRLFLLSRTFDGSSPNPLLWERLSPVTSKPASPRSQR